MACKQAIFVISKFVSEVLNKKMGLFTIYCGNKYNFRWLSVNVCVLTIKKVIL